jgi:predicted TIM-barrel fold metal-dependent hydrolase
VKISRRDVFVGAATLGAGLTLGTSTDLAQDSHSTKPRFIDVHHHYLPPFYVEAIGDKPIAAGTAGVPKWSPEASIETMDRNGVEMAVLSITNPGIAIKDPAQRRSLARECNRYARKLATEHPGRFDAFAALPMPDLDATLDEVKYALDDLKLAGIGLLTNYGDVYLGDPQLDPLLKELNRRKATVFVHPTVPTYSPLDNLLSPAVIEFPHQTVRAITSLFFTGSFSRYPDIGFIFPHAGGSVPFIIGRLQSKKGPDDADAGVLLRRLHYDSALSANPISFPALLKFAGAGKIVFGSDFPFAPESKLAESVSYFNQIAQDNPDVPLIARGNALALMPQLKR